MTFLHSNLAAGRWHTMTICEQLGNAGSEFERAASAKRSGKTARFESALARFLELLDLTASDPRWHAGRQREILRLRELSCAVLCHEPFSESDLAPYSRDFLHYGMSARGAISKPKSETPDAT